MKASLIKFHHGNKIQRLIQSSFPLGPPVIVIAICLCTGWISSHLSKCSSRVTFNSLPPSDTPPTFTSDSHLLWGLHLSPLCRWLSCLFCHFWLHSTPPPEDLQLPLDICIQIPNIYTLKIVFMTFLPIIPLLLNHLLIKDPSLLLIVQLKTTLTTFPTYM